MGKVKAQKCRAENDTAWKIIISAYLKDFVEFFWEEAYYDIDWTRPYENLEQELMAVGIKDNIGKKALDKLFKVFLKNGREQWLLLHIEIQHSKDDEFEERMFVYFYRIFDKYHQDIASLALLSDSNKDWRPNQYKRRIWKSEISRTFEIIKITDFKERKEDLYKNSNPFALVVLIQLAALETKANDKNRLLTKLEFFRCLHQYGWSIEKSMEMYRFLDILLSLNRNFEVEYLEEAKKIDEEFQMNLMTTAERHGFEQGIQQGIKQGIQEGMQHGEAHLLSCILKAKFKELPEEYIKKINSADANTLNQWAINFVNSQSLEEIFQD